MSLWLDHENRNVILDAPQTEFTAQEITNEVRRAEAELWNMSYPPFIDATGKEGLGGEVKVGITLTLLDSWAKFEDRAGPSWELCNVSGGNLTRYNSSLDEYEIPLDVSTYIMATWTNSSSATYSELALQDLKYRIESLRHSHMAFGKTIYWDHVDGDDTNSGLYPESPVKTFAKAHNLVSDHANDVVVNFRALHEPITEAITITKHAMHLRMGRYGPTWTTPGEDAITINSSDVSIEGVVIGDCVRGIVATGPQIQVSNCSINGTTSHGVEFTNVRYGLIDNMQITGCGGDGIRVDHASSSLNHIVDCLAENNVGNGLAVVDGDDLALCGSNRFIGNGGYGIDVQSGATKTLLMGELSLYDNGTGTLSDAGTDTIRQEIATGELVKQLREGNKNVKYILADVDDDDRNVKAGVWDRREVKIKNEEDIDWSSPVVSYVQYAWYFVKGQTNPYEFGLDAP